MSKIQIVWFRELKLWDLKSNLFDNEMFGNSKFLLVKVSTFLYRSKISIKIQDSQFYKRVTIKTRGQGCSLRDTLQGSLIGTKNQFLIKEGQFLISKIDARNGAFGVVGKDIDNAIITGNFWTYDIDTSKVNAHFLALFTTTQYFIEFCKACSGGTTGRHYLDESKFLNAKIPLPPLEIQQEIVAKIEHIKAQIKALHEEEKDLRAEIERYIYTTLGVKSPKESHRQKVFIVRFKDLTRWDTKHNQAYALPLHHRESSAPCHVLHSGESHRDVSHTLNMTRYILPTVQHDKRDISALPQYDNKDCQTKLPLCDFKHSGESQYTSKLRPYLKKIFYYKANEKCYGSSELVGLKFKHEKILNDFILNLLVSNFISQQEQYTSGASLNDIKNFKIPLPPLKVQEQIVAHIESLQSQIQYIDDALNALEQKRLAVLEDYLSTTSRESNERLN